MGSTNLSFAANTVTVNTGTATEMCYHSSSGRKSETRVSPVLVPPEASERGSASFPSPRFWELTRILGVPVL